jgi:hypothetical protein
MLGSNLILDALTNIQNDVSCSNSHGTAFWCVRQTVLSRTEQNSSRYSSSASVTLWVPSPQCVMVLRITWWRRHEHHQLIWTCAIGIMSIKSRKLRFMTMGESFFDTRETVSTRKIRHNCFALQVSLHNRTVAPLSCWSPGKLVRRSSYLICVPEASGPNSSGEKASSVNCCAYLLQTLRLKTYASVSAITDCSSIHRFVYATHTKQTDSTSELYRLSDRHLSTKFGVNFCG